jgi:Ca-activated chloride channel family protein
LTELVREPSGRSQLPNLIIGMPISIVVRLRVPPQPDRAELCRFYVDWEEPGGSAPQRRSQGAALMISPVAAAQWSELPVDPAVAEQVALLMAARARKEDSAAIDRGDATTARDWLDQMRQVIATAPQTAEMASEIQQMDATAERLALGQLGSARKAEHYRQYHRKRGWGTTPRA